jgi:hypothetical protein
MLDINVGADPCVCPYILVITPSQNKIINMSQSHKPAFKRYIGIDYSGAEIAESSLKGLRVYQADNTSEPVEVHPPKGRFKYWTRRGLAEWLVNILSEDILTMVGIDHSFSFPMKYFEAHLLEHDWPAFLDDFQNHWPTDAKYTYVDFIRNGSKGNGAARTGNTRWRRITEIRAGAKSVFHFDVPGSVAKSTHAGLPWLRFIRMALGDKIHFWPFDGWEIPENRSAVFEVYPSMWSKGYPKEGRTPDQHDAFVATIWMKKVDNDGSLRKFLKPDLLLEEYSVVLLEGWILGVM